MPFMPPNQRRQRTVRTFLIGGKSAQTPGNRPYSDSKRRAGEIARRVRRNRFINRYGETDNYLCQMLR